MRPDVEEYEDVEETKHAGNSRAMSWAVLAVAVGGFAALAYYAYQSGTTPVEGVTVSAPNVRAAESAIQGAVTTAPSCRRHQVRSRPHPSPRALAGPAHCRPWPRPQSADWREPTGRRPGAPAG